MFTKVANDRPPQIEQPSKGKAHYPTNEIPLLAGVVLTLVLGIVVGWCLCFLFVHVGMSK